MLVKNYKPIAKSLPPLFSKIKITDDTIVTVKADGGFNLFSYSRHGESFTLNLWDTKRTDLPCILELKEALDRQPIDSAKLLLELYAVEDDKMLQLPKYIHNVKTGDKGKVRAGIFDLISINGTEIKEGYAWKLEEVESWLKNCKLCHVLPHIKPESVKDIENFWNTWVKGRNYEGLFVRVSDSLFKVKKRESVDVVLIGINKRAKLKDKQVTSVKYALMLEDGRFLELGDVASGIPHDLRKALYQLLDYKTGEDNDTIFVKPMIVLEVEYTETFQKNRRIFIFNEGKMWNNGMKPFFSLRHPRLLRIRIDKTVCENDLRLSQMSGISTL
ncbi:DNA ligase [subsurface metagenome]